MFAPNVGQLESTDVVIGRRYIPNHNRYVYNGESEGTSVVSHQSIRISSGPSGGKRRRKAFTESLWSAIHTQHQALPEEETFCFRLQMKSFQRNWMRFREVLNFGISGSGTGHEEPRFVPECNRDLDVDVLIVAFGNATDIRDNSRELGGKPIIHFAFDEHGKLYQVPEAISVLKHPSFLITTASSTNGRKPK
ncbi:MAG: hypothetical protein R3C05_06700 [Pirellulaceae bacterium]